MKPATFGDCVSAAAGTPGFVQNFDRLHGTSLATMATRAPIERMIDEATGRERDECLLFLACVYDVVYCRVPR